MIVLAKGFIHLERGYRDDTLDLFHIYTNTAEAWSLRAEYNI